MKVFIYLALILFLFLFIFVKSNTWQARVIEKTMDGDVYFVTEHSIHWDRFTSYIIDTPRRITHWFKKLK